MNDIYIYLYIYYIYVTSEQPTSPMSRTGLSPTDFGIDATSARNIGKICNHPHKKPGLQKAGIYCTILYLHKLVIFFRKLIPQIVVILFCELGELPNRAKFPRGQTSS